MLFNQQYEGIVTANKWDFYECLSTYSNKNMRRKKGGKPDKNYQLSDVDKASA